MPHIHELIDYTISVFIIHDNQILLVEHPRYDKWLPIGGHIELDETPEQALFREIDEESGLNVRILSDKPDGDEPDQQYLLRPNYLDVHDANPPHRHVAFIYFGVSDSSAFRKSAEHTDMRWVAADNLENPQYHLAPHLLFYARAAFAAAKTS